MSNRFIYITVFLLGILLFSFNLSAKRKLDIDALDSFSNLIVDQEKWLEKVAPDFTLTLLDGSEFKLSDNIGKKIVILNFFATWCGPCRREMPELSSFYRSRQADNFIMIGIDADENPDIVKSFVVKMRVSFPVGIDNNGAIAEDYSADGLPTTVVIGADGLIKLYEVGAIANAEISLGPYLDEGISSIAKGEGISREEYLALLNVQQEDMDPPEEPEKERLTGRGKEISEKMFCPCGCDDLVDECGCNTADKIKAKLIGMDFEGKSDTEIILALNKEFCVRDDKSK